MYYLVVWFHTVVMTVFGYFVSHLQVKKIVAKKKIRTEQEKAQAARDAAMKAAAGGGGAGGMLVQTSVPVSAQSYPI